jgi:hypothetical protein
MGRGSVDLAVSILLLALSPYGRAEERPDTPLRPRRGRNPWTSRLGRPSGSVSPSSPKSSRRPRDGATPSVPPGPGARSTPSPIAAQDAELGEHLALSVKTGTFVAYDPDPAVSISWAV